MALADMRGRSDNVDVLTALAGERIIGHFFQTSAEAGRAALLLVTESGYALALSGVSSFEVVSPEEVDRVLTRDLKNMAQRLEAFQAQNTLLRAVRRARGVDCRWRCVPCKPGEHGTGAPHAFEHLADPGAGFVYHMLHDTEWMTLSEVVEALDSYIAQDEENTTHVGLPKAPPVRPEDVLRQLQMLVGAGLAEEEAGQG